MIKLSLSVVRVAAFCVPLVLVASCGSGSGAQAVQGSKIVISPDATAQTVIVGNTGVITTKPYTITLLSPTGYPEIGVDLLISSPGFLYFADTSVDPVTFAPLGAMGSSHTVTTDGSGKYTVAVSYTSGTTPKGDVTILNVWSGTSYNRVNITYTCQDDTSVVPTVTCP